MLLFAVVATSCGKNIVEPRPDEGVESNTAGLGSGSDDKDGSDKEKDTSPITKANTDATKALNELTDLGIGFDCKETGEKYPCVLMKLKFNKEYADGITKAQLEKIAKASSKYQDAQNTAIRAAGNDTTDEEKKAAFDELAAKDKIVKSLVQYYHFFNEGDASARYKEIEAELGKLGLGFGCDFFELTSKDGCPLESTTGQNSDRATQLDAGTKTGITPTVQEYIGLVDGLATTSSADGAAILAELFGYKKAVGEALLAALSSDGKEGEGEGDGENASGEGSGNGAGTESGNGNKTETDPNAGSEKKQTTSTESSKSKEIERLQKKVSEQRKVIREYVSKESKLSEQINKLKIQIDDGNGGDTAALEAEVARLQDELDRLKAGGGADPGKLKELEDQLADALADQAAAHALAAQYLDEAGKLKDANDGLLADNGKLKADNDGLAKANDDLGKKNKELLDLIGILEPQIDELNGKLNDKIAELTDAQAELEKKKNYIDPDTDGDGVPDLVDEDGDGIPDAIEDLDDYCVALQDEIELLKGQRDAAIAERDKLKANPPVNNITEEYIENFVQLEKKITLHVIDRLKPLGAAVYTYAESDGLMLDLSGLTFAQGRHEFVGSRRSTQNFGKTRDNSSGNIKITNQNIIDLVTDILESDDYKLNEHKFAIFGHVNSDRSSRDPDGEENFKLSERRANTIADILKGKVKRYPERIVEVTGKGESEPFMTIRNGNVLNLKEDKARSRRVQIKIYWNPEDYQFVERDSVTYTPNPDTNDGNDNTGSTTP